ncbi:hypothetical protein Cs7R123_47210 [Catellatospora sp. TT07R-123]|nr:hypothetical protein Cs7R123_47210 [Catellatospora sp. TT07R-123]
MCNSPAVDRDLTPIRDQVWERMRVRRRLLRALLPLLGIIVMSGMVVTPAQAASRYIEGPWYGEEVAYYCGPAAVQMAIARRYGWGPPPETQFNLAVMLDVYHTPVVWDWGMPSAEQSVPILNWFNGTSFYHYWPTIDGFDSIEDVIGFADNVRYSIDNDYPVVVNLKIEPNDPHPPNYPVRSTSIYHYVTIVGYNNDNFTIADPAGSGGADGVLNDYGWGLVPKEWTASAGMLADLLYTGYAAGDSPDNPALPSWDPPPFDPGEYNEHPQTPPPPPKPAAVGRLGDFNGDGKKDVAALNLSGDGLWIHRNTSTPGHPSLAAGQSVSTGWGVVSDLMVADYDGDGKDDIVGRFNGTLAVWRSTSTATTFSFTYKSLGTGWDAYSRILPIADFDGDGKKDVAALNLAGDGLWVHRNTSTPGSPSMAGGQSISAGWAVVNSLTTADYDGDGKSDIVGRFDGTLAVWRSTGTASAFSFAYGSVGTGWNDYGKILPIADFNGDGKKDVGALNHAGDGLWIHRNSSTPGNPTPLSGGQSVSVGWAVVNYLMASDFDGDGKEDLIGRFDGTLAVWRSTSTATTFSFSYGGVGTGWDNYDKILSTAPLV